MKEPRWVPRIVVEAVHLDQLREHGGLQGLRDDNALEASLARARQKWTSEPKSDLSTVAAACAFGIAKAHPFNDGNKRSAFLAMTIFLGLNGKEVDASETEVVQLMVALASGSLTESQMASWVRDHLTRYTPAT
ncbi:MAG: type II toxin-antitoxin system death-on-curing family toxin, partial [Gemmatimonadota bacterium]